ncbi:hypothetical protein K439DRAFT_1625215 [Ramaria rubella]|nr:hypothetical protein K439DRAFT_1625215 [Ramaria rubella]
MPIPLWAKHQLLPDIFKGKKNSKQLTTVPSYSYTSTPNRSLSSKHHNTKQPLFDVIMNASAEILVESRNVAYLTTILKIQSLETQNNAINALYKQLLAKITQVLNDTTGMSLPVVNASPADNRPVVFSGTPLATTLTFPPDEILDLDKYPDITYWSKGQWMDHKKSLVITGANPDSGKQPPHELNWCSAYITTTKGVGVTRYQAQAIRDLAWQLWQSLAEQNQAPQCLGQCYLSSQPILLATHNHWKAKQIASEEYSSWSKSYRESSQKCERKDTIPPQTSKKAKVEHTTVAKSLIDVQAPSLKVPSTSIVSGSAAEPTSDPTLSSLTLLYDNAHPSLPNISSASQEPTLPSMNASPLALPVAISAGQPASTMQTQPSPQTTPDTLHSTNQPNQLSGQSPINQDSHSAPPIVPDLRPQASMLSLQVTIPPAGAAPPGLGLPFPVPEDPFNLFGINYTKTHPNATKKEVRDAFAGLLVAACKELTAQGARNKALSLPPIPVIPPPAPAL